MNMQDVKASGPKRKARRRVGRGPGSGTGCTAGRGNKGQGSRAGAGGSLRMEGGRMPIYRQMPKRGFTNALFKVRHAIVNVDDLAKAFPDGGDVDLAAVKQVNLVKKKAGSLKILAKGEIAVALKVKANKVSEAAKGKIEAAGGSVEIV